MKIPPKFMQGHLNQQEKALKSRLFLLSNSFFIANHYKGFLTLSNLSFILNQLLVVFDKANCFLQ